MDGIITKGYGKEFQKFEEALEGMKKTLDKRSLGYFLYELSQSAVFQDLSEDERMKAVLARRKKVQEKPGMSGKPNRSSDLNELVETLGKAYGQAIGNYEKISDRHKRDCDASAWEANADKAERYFRYKLRELAGVLVAEAGGE